MATAKKSATKKSAVKKSPAKKSAAKTPAAKTSATKTAPARTSAQISPKPAKAAASKKPAPAAKSASKKASSPDKYTKPDLREHIKEDILQGDKGGRPGQWSARKAQMVAHAYEAEGGGYKGGRDETQESLTHWGEEHWTTSDGKPAERGDGMHRYLPEDAWKKLSPAEKKATDKKKLAGDHQGKQFIPNTAPAVKARKAAQKK